MGDNEQSQQSITCAFLVWQCVSYETREDKLGPDDERTSEGYFQRFAELFDHQGSACSEMLAQHLSILGI